MQIVAKIFEGCIANIIDEKLVFHDNQFGFVKKWWLWKGIIYI